MARLSSIFILFFLISQLAAQDYVGFHLDIDGAPIEGYLDQIQYQPEKKVTHVSVPMHLERGFYRDNKGDIHDGYILLRDNKIKFSQNKYEKGKNVKFNEIEYFYIVEDSFLITHKLVDQGLYFDATNALNYFTSFDKFHLARFRSEGDLKYALNIQGQKNWNVIPTRSNGLFRKYMQSLFSDITFLVNDLKENKYKKDDILKVLGVVQSYYKYKHRKPIFFDDYWQVTNNPSAKVYEGRIQNFEDGIFSMEIYKD